MLFLHIQHIVVILFYRFNNSICQNQLHQKLWFSFFDLETWLFGLFLCNLGNACQQCYVEIQGDQVAFALGSPFCVGKFEMNCLHRDLHRNGRLATTISCFCVQLFTWLSLTQKIKSTHSFVVFFDALMLLNIDSNFFHLGVLFLFLFFWQQNLTHSLMI